MTERVDPQVEGASMGSVESTGGKFWTASLNMSSNSTESEAIGLGTRVVRTKLPLRSPSGPQHDKAARAQARRPNMRKLLPCHLATFSRFYPMVAHGNLPLFICRKVPRRNASVYQPGWPRTCILYI